MFESLCGASHSSGYARLYSYSDQADFKMEMVPVAIRHATFRSLARLHLLPGLDIDGDR